jgi:hypothetical protein
MQFKCMSPFLFYMTTLITYVKYVYLYTVLNERQFQTGLSKCRSLTKHENPTRQTFFRKRKRAYSSYCNCSTPAYLPSHKTGPLYLIIYCVIYIYSSNVLFDILGGGESVV